MTSKRPLLEISFSPLDRSMIAIDAQIHAGAPPDISGYEWRIVDGSCEAMTIPHRNGGVVVFRRKYVLSDGRALDWYEPGRTAVLFGARP